MYNKTETKNTFDIVTNEIIKQLEEGIIPWNKPWIEGTSNLPFNRITKKTYKGINRLLLRHEGEYATFNQWTNLGGKIKKGEKAEIVTFWKVQELSQIKNLLTEDENGNEITPEEETKQYNYILRFYKVFHISQVEGVKPLETNDTKQLFDDDTTAEEIISNYSQRENIKINYYGNEAYYSPSKDHITMPEKWKFKENSNQYYSTIFHEIIHSTGHEKRLNRLKANANFGNEEYSKEELVAEIGACGILNMLNISSEKSFRNNVAYIQNWIQALKNDKKLIVFASSQSEKATNYVFNGKGQ